MSVFILAFIKGFNDKKYIYLFINNNINKKVFHKEKNKDKINPYKILNLFISRLILTLNFLSLFCFNLD